MDRLTIKNAGSVLFLPTSDIDWMKLRLLRVLYTWAGVHLLRRSMNDSGPISIRCSFAASTARRCESGPCSRMRFASDAEYELVLPTEPNSA